MRIVIATPLYPPEIGGPATYARLLAEGLPGKGVEVELVKFSSARHLPKLIRHYAYYRRVLHAAREADAILALDPVSVGLPALWAARRAKKPLAVKIVGDYAWEQGRQRFGVSQGLDDFVRTRQSSLRVRLLQRIETQVAKCATWVIVPSEYLKGVVSAWGISEPRIKVIYNAVPLEPLGTVPAVVGALGRPLVVTAGRLVPWKHIDGIIDAVARAGASLVVVGDGPLRPLLEGQAQQMLANHAVFSGALAHADTIAVIKSADAFVLNSSYEGFSHILVEALALGTPVLATGVGGNQEIITDGENGVLVPPSDPEALTRALVALLGNKPLCTRLSVNAKLSVERFSLAAMLERTSDLLMALV